MVLHMYLRIAAFPLGTVLQRGCKVDISTSGALLSFVVVLLSCRLCALKWECMMNKPWVVVAVCVCLHVHPSCPRLV